MGGNARQRGSQSGDGNTGTPSEPFWLGTGFQHEKRMARLGLDPADGGSLPYRSAMDFLQAHPLLLAPIIFFCRVADVSLGTTRTILVFRGQGWLAASIGFFESLIWLTAAALVIRDLSAWYLAIAYAGGYATGNVVGIWLEAKMAVGEELVRAISVDRSIQLGDRLREAGYSVTELEGRGAGGVPVEVLLVVEARRRVPHLLERIVTVDPRAVYSVSDVKRNPRPLRIARRRWNPLSWMSISKRK